MKAGGANFKGRASVKQLVCAFYPATAKTCCLSNVSMSSAAAATRNNNII